MEWSEKSGIMISKANFNLSFWFIKAKLKMFSSAEIFLNATLNPQ